METSHVLAQYIVDARYEDLPAEAIEVTKKSILDTLGVILAASTLGESGVKEIVELAGEGGGREESTILGFGRKVPVLMAALANGAMAHQLDYDDCFDVGVVIRAPGPCRRPLLLGKGRATSPERISSRPSPWAPI